MYGEESLTKLNKIKRLDPAFEFQNLKHNKYKKRGWGYFVVCIGIIATAYLFMFTLKFCMVLSSLFSLKN